MRTTKPARLAATLVASAGLAVWCGQARAQGYGGATGVPAGVDPTAGAAGKRITVEGSADVTYDDNISGGDPALAKSRGLTPEDEIYGLTLSTLMLQPIGSQKAFLQATGQLRDYQHNSTLNSANVQSTGGFSGRVGPCAVIVSGGYANRRTEQAELLIAQTIKNTQTDIIGQGSLNCRRGRLTGGVMVNHVDVRNSAKSSGYLDSISDTASVQAGYVSDIIGEIYLVGQEGWTSYGLPRVVGALQPPDFRTLSGGLSFKRRVGLRLSGEMSLFYTSAKSNNAAGSTLGKVDFSGLTANVRLTYSPTHRTSLDLVYARAVRPSPSVASSIDLAETYTFDVNYALSSRIEIHLGATEQHDDYGGQLNLPNVVQRDRRTTEFANASLKVGRFATLRLNAEHSNRDTNLPLFNGDDNRVTLGVTGKF